MCSGSTVGIEVQVRLKLWKKLARFQTKAQKSSFVWDSDAEFERFLDNPLQSALFLALKLSWVGNDVGSIHSIYRQCSHQAVALRDSHKKILDGTWKAKKIRPHRGKLWVKPTLECLQLSAFNGQPWQHFAWSNE